MDHRFYFEHVFYIIWGNQCCYCNGINAIGVQNLDRNTTEEIVVDGTPEVMNLVVHKRYGYDPRIFHTKYLEDDGSIYGGGFSEKRKNEKAKRMDLFKERTKYFLKSLI